MFADSPPIGHDSPPTCRARDVEEGTCICCAPVQVLWAGLHVLARGAVSGLTVYPPWLSMLRPVPYAFAQTRTRRHGCSGGGVSGTLAPAV